MSIPPQLLTVDKHRLPTHIAVIMDGNGRWATAKGNNRIFGHKSAIQAVRDTVEGAAELGIPFVTLYAFSTENWNRPRLEVEALMQLLNATLKSETETLIKNNVKLTVIGNTSDLPSDTLVALNRTMEITRNNTHMTLTLALSYGSRADLCAGIRQMVQEVKTGRLNEEAITPEVVSRYLSTRNMPDPELLIRTSGEFRVSNFMLWEIAYAEIYISAKMWPDFRRQDLYAAIQDYLSRERRFGKTSEQVQANQ